MPIQQKISIILIIGAFLYYFCKLFFSFLKLTEENKQLKLDLIFKKPLPEWTEEDKWFYDNNYHSIYKDMNFGYKDSKEYNEGSWRNY
jgi:hypothetical protein